MLVHAELRESNGEVLGPAEEGLAEEGDGDHEAFVVRSVEGEQGAEEDHADPAYGKGDLVADELSAWAWNLKGGIVLLSDQVTKSDQQTGTKDKTEVSW